MQGKEFAPVRRKLICCSVPQLTRGRGVSLLVFNYLRCYVDNGMRAGNPVFRRWLFLNPIFSNFPHADLERLPHHANPSHQKIISFHLLLTRWLRAVGYSLPSVIGVDGKAHAKELLHHSGMDFVPGGANCLSCLGNGLPSLFFVLMPLHRRIDDMSQSLLPLVRLVVSLGRRSRWLPWNIFSSGSIPLPLSRNCFGSASCYSPARASSLLLHGVFAVKCTSEIRRPAGKRPSVRRGPTKQAAGDFKWGRALSRLHQRLSQAGLPITEIQLIQPD